MAKKFNTNLEHKDAVPKRTSIGHGRRKLGSFTKTTRKKYRGQGKR